ncbi:biotin-lipoyl like family protein [Serratia marcescens]|nr:biotin-lipoyl like family protein [Serratia marcescens]
MNKKRSALIVLLILLIAAAAYAVWHYQQQQDKPLTLYGNVDIRTVNLGFRVDGRLASLTVDEGDAVQPGQLLGKLDDAPIATHCSRPRPTSAARVPNCRCCRPAIAAKRSPRCSQKWRSASPPSPTPTAS